MVSFDADEAVREREAMAAISKALESLEQHSARQRVLRWAAQTFQVDLSAPTNAPEIAGAPLVEVARRLVTDPVAVLLLVGVVDDAGYVAGLRQDEPAFALRPCEAGELSAWPTAGASWPQAEIDPASTRTPGPMVEESETFLT